MPLPNSCRWERRSLGLQRKIALKTLQFGLQSCGPATQWKTGRTTKMGKKREKRGKFAPIEDGEKKWPKSTEKMENWPDFPFFRSFSAIFSHFRSGQIFHVFPIFVPHFVVRPVFHCVAGPHDCKIRGCTTL